MEFTCTVTNMIQNDLTVKVEWRSMNAIDTGVRTHIHVIPGGGSLSVSFSGQIVEKGDINSVIEASEPGAVSSMAFTSIQIEAINSADGDSFEDILEKAQEVPHIQEIVAVTLAVILALFLAYNARRNNLKQKAERREHINQRLSGRYVMDENSRFDRLPPRNQTESAKKSTPSDRLLRGYGEVVIT